MRRRSVEHSRVTYKPRPRAETYTFRRNEKPDIGALVGAHLFTVPILWLTQYKGYRAYEFDCAPAADG